MASGVIDSSRAHEPTDASPAADITGTGEGLETKSFADFGVSEPIVRALEEHGITHPFPIQALTLPVALTGHDIIGQAKTGTGKTLGFGIPLLEVSVGPGEEGWEAIRPADQGKPQALVVLPTRELAKQVALELRNAAAHRSLRIVDIYGGRAYEPQQEALAKGVEIVVGTPGRIIDLMKHGTLVLSHVRTVVLDEADEMLDLGFLDDVEKILSAVPPTRHTMLFSATMPGPVITMARRYMTKPTHIRAHTPGDDSATVKNIRQVAYRVHALNKDEVVSRILQARGRDRSIIFCRTKRNAARLADTLRERGFAVGSLHGDLGQGAREQTLRAFRKGKIDVLVATDVAARGIDVDDVTHVINYQCPEDEKIYIHRIGRTGRAGNKGTAVTFVDWEDMPRWSLISKQLNLGMADPVETYHTSDHLYTDLDIPTDAGPTLPESQRVLAGLDAEEIEDLGETGHSRGGRGNSRRHSAHRGQRARGGTQRSSSARGSRRAKSTTTKTEERSGAGRRRTEEKEQRSASVRTRRRLGTPRTQAETPAASERAGTQRRRRKLSRKLD
ncbi:DEAD/DEAH box helicase [Actinotignum sanguinis]|uniref:RNA helicase n=1 Tax=Actinotignum sanguinis TaxID=1445614 RepID=A0ABT5V3T4_9ACTO|nr:DEAD/DEAH box helicase [Actinotignum sanguinis]MDE1655491.1 DEAD/DEAH box helicase [Actinotignum sanguinis]MDK8286786.1 DEAD/DEAH box helicase [Actinotignum sanguinis]MDK8352310.1 DEAD/DEAH box helicase [Actinotignum sanguinis]MDK8650683.1 DEAD/DEAH box helicase [Actinotignum sanguinis]MDK8801089.1 DEAD/DEAH box helicase [Actinotignum sanguinis]